LHQAWRIMPWIWFCVRIVAALPVFLAGLGLVYVNFVSVLIERGIVLVSVFSGQWQRWPEVLDGGMASIWPVMLAFFVVVVGVLIAPKRLPGRPIKRNRHPPRSQSF